MQILTLIVGIVIGVFGVNYVHDKYPDTRPDYCQVQQVQEVQKPSVGEKLDKVLKVIQE